LESLRVSFQHIQVVEIKKLPNLLSHSLFCTTVGVGVGTKDFPHHANIVRVAIGTKCEPNVKSYVNPLHENLAASTSPLSSSTTLAAKETKHDQKEEDAVKSSVESESVASHTGENLVVLETNIDDLNPQVIGYVQELLLKEKALDVWTQPIQVK
jgi:uncharacterized protein (DUF111 family)